MNDEKRRTGNYKGVSLRTATRKNYLEVNANPWAVHFRKGSISINTSAPTERKAAILYDKICIKYGLPPVNILKPVKK